MEYANHTERSPQALEAMESAGVRKAIDQRLAAAGSARKAHFEKMAREALADAGYSEDMADDAVSLIQHRAERDGVDVPVVQVRDRESAPEGRSVPVDAPVSAHMAASSGRSRPKVEYNKPMPRDASFADLPDVPDRHREVSLGKYLRGSLFGKWDNADAELSLYQERVMSGASSGAGGALLPTILSSQIVDLARVQTRTIQAGAQVIPMDNRTVVVPKWASDPSVGWRAENASVTTSDGSLSTVTFTANSLAGYTTLSREIVEDTDLEGVLESAYGKAVAIAFDLAALKGTGTNQPTGLYSTTAITDRSALSANGATPTWDNVIDMVAGIRGRSENVSAVIWHPRNGQTLAKVKDTTNAYLQPPAYLDGIPRLETATLPITETQGTSGVTNSMFAGDFSMCGFGVRTEFGINLYEQPAATTGQLLMLAWFRGDFQVLRGTAFAHRTGLLP